MTEPDIFNALWIAVSAWVITGPLMDSDMVLEPYRIWLERISRRALWLAKPMGLCGTCFAGQFALWFFLFDTRGVFAPVSIVFFICITIFLHTLIAKWMK